VSEADCIAMLEKMRKSRVEIERQEQEGARA